MALLVKKTDDEPTLPATHPIQETTFNTTPKSPISVSKKQHQTTPLPNTDIRKQNPPTIYLRTRQDALLPNLHNPTGSKTHQPYP